MDISLPNTDLNSSAKVWVAFTGETDLNFLKILKKDFRHCFAVVFDGEKWLSIDPLANHMDITIHNVPSDFDLPAWLQSRGYKLVEARIDRSKKTMAPIFPFTCVEAVKRYLGIHALHVITPYQLYCHLNRHKRGFNGQPNFNNKELNYGTLDLSPQGA